MNPKIIHRDIKPENILLDENNKAYLIDFGWSNYIINHRKRNSICGSPFYLSPEMVNEKGHDELNDIWCIGVLLFELTTGKVPFEGNDIDEVRNNIINFNMKYPSDINPDAKDLITKILKVNPNDRLSLEKILSHNFIKKYFPNALNELIKPKKLNNKIFVVSVENPKTWNEAKNKEIQNIMQNNSKNSFIKKTYTFSISNKKNLISPSKKEDNNYKKNILNNVNNTKNNYNYKRYDTKCYSKTTLKTIDDNNPINNNINKNNDVQYISGFKINDNTNSNNNINCSEINPNNNLMTVNNTNISTNANKNTKNITKFKSSNNIPNF